MLTFLWIKKMLEFGGNMEKIKDNLLEKGYIVRTELISLSQDSLCIRKEHKPFTFKSLESFSPDVILSISCLAGAYGIMKSINKSIHYPQLELMLQ